MALYYQGCHRQTEKIKTEKIKTRKKSVNPQGGSRTNNF